MRRLVSLLAFAAAVAAPSLARAYERQQHLGADALGVYMTSQGKGKLGLDLSLHYTYGISDALNLVADVGGAGFPSAGGATVAQPGHILYGGVGVLYVFDVLRWVPYAGGILGPAAFGGGSVSGFVAPDLQIAAGLDYAIDREWSVGLAYRQHVFLGKTGDYPEYTSVGLRAEYTWGW